MLQDKDTIILREISNFFTEGEKAINTIFGITRSLLLSRNRILPKEANNQKYRNHDKLLLLLLFPLFKIKDAYHYDGSALDRIVSCGKDVFYRMLNDENMDWRSLCYCITKKLIEQARQKGENTTVGLRCLIIDDTDLPKTGRCMELIGRVYSHVTHTSLLAFKGLFMAYHDGKSLYALDFSLHGEKGKNEKKPYGLTASQSKNRYTKKRAKGSYGYARKEEYFTTKIASMISMIRICITNGVRFDYLLVDSWFTCYQLVAFIKSRRIGCHLLGMIKMGKTNYCYNGKDLSSKQIVDALRRCKKTKRSKATGFYYGHADVLLKGIKVRLFFSKATRRGRWHGMLSTNLELTFEQAYKIYATRWTIEIYFKESKQYLGLGKCESQDFDAQIAHTSLCMMQYNILSLAKRFDKYETLGVLFRETIHNTLEITLADRIWMIITSLVARLVVILDVDQEMLMENLIVDNQELTELINLKPYFKAA